MTAEDSQLSTLAWLDLVLDLMIHLELHIPVACWTDSCGKKNGPKDIHILTPGTCEHVRLHGKEKLREQI